MIIIHFGSLAFALGPRSEFITILKSKYVSATLRVNPEMVLPAGLTATQAPLSKL